MKRKPNVTPLKLTKNEAILLWIHWPIMKALTVLVYRLSHSHKLPEEPIKPFDQDCCFNILLTQNLRCTRIQQIFGNFKVPLLKETYTILE